MGCFCLSRGIFGRHCVCNPEYISKISKIARPRLFAFKTNSNPRIMGLATKMDHIRTNIFFFDLVDQRLTNDEFVARLKEQGVLLHHAGPSHFRMVTHY